MRIDQVLSQLLMNQSDTLSTQCRRMEHLHEKVWCIEINNWPNGSFSNSVIFSCMLSNWGYSSEIVFALAGQLISKLLLKVSHQDKTSV